MSRKCPRCTAWLWSESHTCPPRWMVATADNPDDWREIYAYDAETAAEEFAEQYEDDCAEYQIAEGATTLEVLVRAAPVYVDVTAKLATTQRFKVQGEYVARYSATECD